MKPTVNRFVGLALAMATVAACSSEPGDAVTDPYEGTIAPAPTPGLGAPNESSRRLEAISEPARFAMLRNVVTGSRAQCAAVNAASRRRQLDSADVWIVTCSDSGAWAIKLNADGSARVLSCDFMAKSVIPCDKL